MGKQSFLENPTNALNYKLLEVIVLGLVRDILAVTVYSIKKYIYYIYIVLLPVYKPEDLFSLYVGCLISLRTQTYFRLSLVSAKNRSRETVCVRRLMSDLISIQSFSI